MQKIINIKQKIMKRIKFLTLVAIFATIISCNSTSNETKTETQPLLSANFSIDTASSIINWKGSMVGMYAHTGTLKFTSGEFSLTDGKMTSGTFVVDLKSMLTTDDDALYKMAPREKLIGHLLSDDFFSAEKFPTASFEFISTDASVLKGKLTIKGIANDVDVTDLLISEKDGQVSASGKLVFDRQKFGVTYKSTMKDMVLSDDIELEISINGIKK